MGRPLGPARILHEAFLATKFRAICGPVVLFLLVSCSILGRSRSGDPNVLFFDDFQDNRHGWLIEDTERTRSDIEHGDYVIAKKARWGISARSIECMLNQEEDFVIETVITKREGCDEYGYGIIWGCKTSRDTYKFVITGEGRHLYGRVEYSDWRGMDAFGWSGSVHTGNATNKLALRKVESTLFLLVNDSLVHVTEFEAFTPSNVGFILEDRMKIEVESLVVRRLGPE